MKCTWLVCLGLIVAPVAGQDTIEWSKAAAGELPKAAANDTRPTILYFTFDT